MVRGDAASAEMTQEARKKELAAEMASVRARTLALLEEVPEEYLKRRIHDFYSPIGWHFGHIGRTEEYWVLKEGLRRPCLDDHLSFLFADLPENPKEARVHLPSRAEIVTYLSETRSRSLEALAGAQIETEDALVADGYGWEFAIQHECQHQETIAEMLQLIQKDAWKQAPSSDLPPSADWQPGLQDALFSVSGGSFEMGSDCRHGYDNEKRAHRVEVAPFRVACTPVTAYQWSEFVTDGGYRRRELWSAPGWRWRENERAEAPEYTVPSGDGHFAFGPFGVRAVHPDEPATSLSWYEAEAYTNWKGMRMLTEEEWEYLASLFGEPSEARCALEVWSPQPCRQGRGVGELLGNAWEWTASAFLPYSGFEAFPYEGYSKDHMRGEHRVCRGGSWATSRKLLRRSFRNWYVPTYRQGFLGLRLAANEG